MRRVALLLIILCAPCLLAGCADTVRLKAVDVASGRPLQGVTVVWRQDAVDLLFGVRHRGPRTLPPSKEDGIITVRGVRHAWTTSFVFTRDEFATLYGVYSPNSLALARRTNSAAYAWRPIALQGPTVYVQSTNGFFTVQMKHL